MKIQLDVHASEGKQPAERVHETNKLNNEIPGNDTDHSAPEEYLTTAGGFRSQLGEDDMLDWNDYRRQLMGRIGEMGKLSPDTLAGYQTLSAAGRKTNHLDAKTRELIALAVAVTSRCDGCIAVHAAEASKLGASREEVAEALGVAVALNAGAAMVYSARALDAWSAVSSA